MATSTNSISGFGPTIQRVVRGLLSISILCIALTASAKDRLELKVSLNPSTVFGGVSSTGTVTLNQAAPASGILVTVASNNSAATVPASVTVASGQKSATFTVATTAVTSQTEAWISASFGKAASYAQLRIQTLAVQSLALTPTSVTGGNTSSGLVTLNGAAPSGGTVVNLASNSAAATVPASVTVAEGQTSATFAVSTTSVVSQARARISASLGKSYESADLAIEPSITFTVAMNPSTVGGGARLTGTVTLSAAAPKGGIEVSLSSSSNQVFVQDDIRIQSGATSATFGVQTAGVATSTTATITASIGNVSETATLTLTPASLASVSVKPGTIGGGSSAYGIVSLSGVAPSGGLVVSLASDQTSVAVPVTVTIPSGRSNGLFAITTTVVTTQTVATITASLGAVSQTASLTVTPLTLSSLGVFPGDVIGGNSVTGIVELNGPAGTGGVVVSLASGDPSVTVPASVTVAAGSNKAKFAITTAAVTTQIPVTVTATLGSQSKTATLTLNPVSLDNLEIKPSRIVGGGTATGTINLTGPAPAGGLVVVLASNSSSATVPATVTVPAGQNSVTFLVQSSVVTSKTKVQITATLGAATVTEQLTVSQQST